MGEFSIKFFLLEHISEILISEFYIPEVSASGIFQTNHN